MKIYLAGYYNGKASAYALSEEQYSYYLESYHYINNKRHCNMIRDDKRTIFLDSGAYSMFTQGVTVDLDSYAKFVIDNDDILHTASNLDHIGAGGEQKTYDNQKYIESKGAKIQPVVHVRDTDDWLEKYMAEGYDYIFIGGMVPESTPYLLSRLDQMWADHLTNPDGTAKIKVHGFGLTVLSLMERYPWYSVDSTSWVLTGRFGSVYLRQRNGRVIKVCVSDKSPRVKDWDMHYDTMPPLLKKETRDLFAEGGFDVEELRSIYWKRDLWNIQFFKALCDGPAPKFFLEKGLFDG